MRKNQYFSIVFIFFLLITLPLMIVSLKKIQQYLSRAQGVPANIVIETKSNLGNLPKPWQALAQGGEEKEQMLTPTVPLIKPLAPKYIRIDHIFDFYQVVGGEKNGKMTYDFSRLDRIVNDILSVGAKPMLSLSYMPPVISAGDITDPPSNWLDWQEVVKTIIEYYSGRNRRNLTDVIYEVWNEPDLFGKWKTYGEKDYRLLYFYAAKGANLAQNVNSFKIGGPATTAFYKNWLEEFIKYIYENNLRLDFFSWHKYSLSPEDFLADINFIDLLLTRHGGSYLLPKFITEWGSNAENSSIHDTGFDAAYTLAVIRQILDRVDLAFTFEIKDGPPPAGKTLWGRWGILTYDLVKKPRYFALLLLNKMQGKRLKLTGEGTWVTGFAAKEGNTIRLILVNYDKEGRHSETLPLTFTGLEPGNYKFSQTDLYGKILTTREIVNQETLTKTIFLPTNSLVLLELES